MNKEEITAVLEELHNITGFRVSLHGVGYEEIAAYPPERLPFCERVNRIEAEYKRCRECDKIACRVALDTEKTHIYKCRFGLTEAVSPLYNFGTLTGFLMMGQICESPEAVINAEKALSELTKNNEEAAILSKKIPVIRPEMASSYLKIMTICAQYLTLSNAVPSTKPGVAELARVYIDENSHKKLVIADICDELKCSKSTLLTGFKKKYGTTINAYLTHIRLERATRLLVEGNMTISEIASETGFSDQSYFSKVFSAKYGIPPSEYRTSKEGY